MDFQLEHVLGQTAFAECGDPTGVYWHPDRSLIAIASRFDDLQWQGRDCQQGSTCRYRVALYRTETLACIGVFDGSRYPINDVAFHPTEPVMAIAVGAYDGGYLYEGTLYLLDRTTGSAAKALDRQSHFGREFTRCWFSADGRELGLVMRPFDDHHVGKIGARFIETTLPFTDWRALLAEPRRSAGLPAVPRPGWADAEGYARQPRTAVIAELHQLAEEHRQVYEPRWLVWDVAWAPDGRVLACRNATAVECWDRDGAPVRHLPTPGRGVQLLLSPAGDTVFVNHDFERRLGRATRQRLPPVEHIDLMTWERAPISAVGFPAKLSMAATGHLLAHDTRYDEGYGHHDDEPADRSCIVDPDGIVRVATALPPFNLFGRIDQANASAYSYVVDYDDRDWFEAPRRIARENPTDGSVEPMGDRAWESLNASDQSLPEREAAVARYLDPFQRRAEGWPPAQAARIEAQARFILHPHALLNGATILVLSDGPTPEVVQASTVFQARGFAKGEAVIARRRLPGGEPSWTYRCPAPVNALAHAPALDAVVFALNDGQCGALDLKTGAVRALAPLTVAGIPAIALALAVQDDRLAVGLYDGRVLVFRLRG